MTEIESVLRDAAPRALGALARRFDGFDLCEDAVQEALLAASRQWPEDGIPASPVGWLITVATRRRTELWRSDQARRRREEAAAALEPAEPEPVPDSDDTLTLLLLCCHPELTLPAQVALTLRAVGGLSTAEIARGLLVPEATVGQRISRAKQRIRAAGARFELPGPQELSDRLSAVRQVLYLVFTEGHTATAGDELVRVELTDEAIRLTRQLRARLPDDGETAGLLALMLLTDARRPARFAAGALVPLAEQDRSLWQHDRIEEASRLLTATLPASVLGPFQLQAAIAAVHDEAATAAETDWPQILGLYQVLESLAPGPMVSLNRLVAFAEVRGPAAGLRALDQAELDVALAGHYRVAAVRAHLLERLGDAAGSAEQYRRAAEGTTSLPERDHLLLRARRLAP